jgi:hypothetical protein
VVFLRTVPDRKDPKKSGDAEWQSDRHCRIPTYTISTKALYHRFGVHLSRLGMAQRMLSLSGLHRRDKISGLPTWVVDWMIGIGESRQYVSIPVCQVRLESYRAGGIRQPPPSMLAGAPGEEATVLITVGDCIDTISHVTTAFPTDYKADETSRARMFLSWHDEVELLISHTIVENTANTIYWDLNEALAQTLLINNLYIGKNAILTSTPIIFPKRTYRALLRSIQKVASRTGITNPKLPSLCEIEIFKIQIGATLNRRRFAVTNMGYMGLVSEYAKVGDRIAIILGAIEPLVLRETENDNRDYRLQHLQYNTNSDIKTYLIEREDQPRTIIQVVGDCYIHNLIEGQALRFEDFSPHQL